MPPALFRKNTILDSWIPGSWQLISMPAVGPIEIKARARLCHREPILPRLDVV